MACGCCGQKYRPPQGAVQVTQQRVVLPRRRRAIRGVVKNPTPPVAPVQEETPSTPPTPEETK